MSENRKGNKRRSSIITIFIILFFIVIIAFFTINIIEHCKAKSKEELDSTYISNLDEEDMMQYEYKKLNKELEGMYAFAISENSIVAVKENNEIIKLIDIDLENQYDYLYYDTKLFLLEKNTGNIYIISLSQGDGEYSIEETIKLECNVSSFQIYEYQIYYISGNTLLKYNDEQFIIDNITSSNFIIKNDAIYIVKDNNLIKLDKEMNESRIAFHVSELYYYNYYERNKLIYDTQIDNENIFKSIYNFYTNEVYNSIKNNTYFIPYNSSNYIYTTNDRLNLMIINKSGGSNYLLKSKKIINNVEFLKDKYLLVQKEDENIIFDVDNNKIEITDNIIPINNIKYLK